MRTSQNYRFIGILLVLVFLYALTAIAASDFFAGFPTVDPDSVIAKYGTPDVIDSTAYDNPRPPIVTKLFTYKKEDVMLIFMADPPGAPPPYNVWKLIGAEDAQGKRVLSVEEVKERMSKRIKKFNKNAGK